MRVDERAGHPSLVEGEEQPGQKVGLSRACLAQDVHVCSSLTTGYAEGAGKQPQEAGCTEGNGRTTVPQLHAVWNTTPLSLIGTGKSSRDTASPVSAWNQT